MRSGKISLFVLLVFISTSQNAAAQQFNPQEYTNSFLVLILTVIGIFFVASILLGGGLGLVGRFINSIKLKKFDPYSRFPKNFSETLKQRFPNYHIYYVPEKYLKIFDFPEDDTLRGENRSLDWWNALLEVYPEAPKNDDERKEREQQFWLHFVDFFTIKDSNGRHIKNIDGIPSLKPQQEILDYFGFYEKWIFREFYAATGLVRKTIIEKEVLLYMDLARARSFYSDNDHRVVKESDKAIQFNREIFPTHFNEEGGWFYSNINRAFKTKYGGQTFGDGALKPKHDQDDETAHVPIV